MMHHPLISIIIPVYNVGKYLRECINSALNQTYQHLEILCIDDGSTDTSPAILQELAQTDKRIRTITNGINKGPGAARNTGIDNASGDFIFFWIRTIGFKKTASKSCWPPP